MATHSQRLKKRIQTQQLADDVGLLREDLEAARAAKGGDQTIDVGRHQRLFRIGLDEQVSGIQNAFPMARKKAGVAEGEPFLPETREDLLKQLGTDEAEYADLKTFMQPVPAPRAGGMSP
jgi:hypothetical protein